MEEGGNGDCRCKRRGTPFMHRSSAHLKRNQVLLTTFQNGSTSDLKKHLYNNCLATTFVLLQLVAATT